MKEITREYKKFDDLTIISEKIDILWKIFIFKKNVYNLQKNHLMN